MCIAVVSRDSSHRLRPHRIKYCTNKTKKQFLPQRYNNLRIKQKRADGYKQMWEH